MVAVLIIGGLSVGVVFFVVFKRLKRRQQTDSSDAYYDDINDQKTNEDYDANYYEPVNYEISNSSDLDKRNKTVSYLSLYGSEPMNHTKANYHNVTHDNNSEYLQMRF